MFLQAEVERGDAVDGLKRDASLGRLVVAKRPAESRSDSLGRA